MAEFVLNAKRREQTGKGAAKRLRREGKIPGVLYGDGQENILLQIDVREIHALLKSLSGETALIKLRVDGEKGGQWKTIIKELQYDPVKGSLLHVDFQRVSATRKITVEIPVVLTGVPIGVKTKGGILEHLLREVEVECLPSEIPEHIEVDISHLDIGDAIHVSDLKLDKGEILNDPSTAVATVSPPRVLVEEEMVEEAPEVEEKRTGEG